MKKSEIKFTVTLDDKNLPKSIEWDATDKESEGQESTRSISLNVWRSLHLHALPNGHKVL